MRRRVLLIGVAVAALTVGTLQASAADLADEVHVSWGPNGTTAVLHWRGTPTDVAFGATTDYGRTATGAAPAITPVDDPGPFREVRLTGLTAETVYHYRIGTGPDRVFRTQPAPGSPVSWVDVGDTASTTCKPWMAQQHALIAAQQAHVVTHGGDISYANDCGVPAVHGFYTDIETWAASGTSSAAFMPAWGNHEYGAPTAKAPAGTPRDSLANYKGRSAVPNPADPAGRQGDHAEGPGLPGRGRDERLPGRGLGVAG